MKMWCGCSRGAADGEELAVCVGRETPQRPKDTGKHTTRQRQCVCCYLKYSISTGSQKEELSGLDDWQAGRGKVSMVFAGNQRWMGERTLSPETRSVCMDFLCGGACPLTASIAVTSNHSPSNRLNAELTELFNKHRHPPRHTQR